MFRRLKDLIPIMGKENSLTWILFDVPDLGNFRVGNDDFPTHFPILVRQHFFLCEVYTVYVFQLEDIRRLPDPVVRLQRFRTACL